MHTLHERLPLFHENYWLRYQKGNMTLFPQENLVTDSQNQIIAVFIQYHLGAFGSYRLPQTACSCTENLKGFLVGPSVQARGALNAGLCTCSFPP